jgi:hypothetical protein
LERRIVRILRTLQQQQMQDLGLAKLDGKRFDVSP